MRTPISQRTAKTNTKAYNDYFNANQKVMKQAKKEPRKAPYPIRLADIYKEKLQKKADAKGIKLHKYVVQLLIKHAVK
jgi:hypothetical protein